MPADKFLPAIGHAISGATGTAISTTTTYPLDLVNTRLKVQGQLRKDRDISPSEQYKGVADAFAKIYEREGGIRTFYTGLGSDIVKSVADSFLFFLFYTWFRSRRSQANSRRLPAWEELAVGAAAGACARLFTTPIGNVVTRMQTASLLSDDRRSDGDNRDGGYQTTSATDLSFGTVLHAIRTEKGFLGLWAGYGATLVLTLNPSITFYLQHALKKALVDRGREGESSAVTFLVAALSKVVATAVTYPFNIAKARAQVSVPGGPKPRASEKEPSTLGESPGVGQDAGQPKPKDLSNTVARRLHQLADGTIFATVTRIGRTEGISALYDGISGELSKSFFNHGTTMLSKEIVHKLIVQLYFFVLAAIKNSPTAKLLLSRKSRNILNGQKSTHIAEKYKEMRDGLLKGTIAISVMEWTRKRMAVTN